MVERLPDDWRRLLAATVRSDDFTRLARFVTEERRRGPVFPPSDEVFAALTLTPPTRVRAVILGQDPYHAPGQAHGLCFSVRPGVPLPRSLRNIFRELHDDLGMPPPPHGCLGAWARQGVLLLNTVLTVRVGAAGSHRRRGWERFTDAVIRVVAAQAAHTVFVLWGAAAQGKAAMIDHGRHTLIQSAHPSPLSARRGFFGSRPFSRVNAALAAHGQEPIDWTLEPLAE